MKPFFLTRLAILWLLLVVFPVSLSTARESVAAERVRIGLTTKDFGYLPLFVGIRAGYFADEGLDPQWIVVRSNVTTSALIGVGLVALVVVPLVVVAFLATRRRTAEGMPETVDAETEREFAEAEAFEAEWHEADKERFHEERLP